MDTSIESPEAHIEDWAWYMFQQTRDEMYWGIYCMYSVD